MYFEKYSKYQKKKNTTKNWNSTTTFCAIDSCLWNNVNLLVVLLGVENGHGGSFVVQW